MKTEDLKKLGIEDEDLVKQIFALHGKDIEKFKTDLETTQQENAGLKNQLGEASKTIESFKDLDVEAIKKTADDWKQKAEEAQKNAEGQIKALKFDHALESALRAVKAKNPKAVRALLNADDLKLAEDGSIVGLNEQMEKIKSENDYLFESEEPEPKIVVGSKNKTVVGDAMVIAAREAAGLSTE